MIMDNPHTKLLVDEIEDIVYKKFEIYNRTEFENFTNKLAQKDPQINKLMMNIKKSYQKALNGEIEILDIELPKAIDKDLVFNTKKQLTKEELEGFLQYYIQYESTHGRVNPQDIYFSQGLEEANRHV